MDWLTNAIEKFGTGAMVVIAVVIFFVIIISVMDRHDRKRNK